MWHRGEAWFQITILVMEKCESVSFFFLVGNLEGLILGREEKVSRVT
jgi:hypothetical protein